MTDTDDTDELLLIPPDFFSTESGFGHSETAQPYYNIVDNLIKQVGSLQNRIKSIESCESFYSNSLESLKMDRPRESFKKSNSSDDLCTSFSAQNSPQKPVEFKLNSLPNSPNVKKYVNLRNPRVGLQSKLSPSAAYSNKYTRSGKDGQLLNEVDTFLSKVKTIQRISAVRNLESDFENCGAKHNEPEVVTYFERRNEPIRQKTLQMGDGKYNIRDLETRVQDMLNGPKERIETAERKEKSDVQTSTDNSKENSNLVQELLQFNDQPSCSDSSSDSTQITAYNRTKNIKTNLLTDPIHSNALKVLHLHKKLHEDPSKKAKSKENAGEHKQRSKHTIVGDNLGTHLSLLNLADIWNSENNTLTRSQLTQKLQEEKYRRQHCEDLIQELQVKNLELQQKMSVAVKVDDAKNTTIQKYQDALDKLVSKLEKCNKDRVELEFEINKLKNERIDEKEDADQRITHYENEIQRALSVAHTSQEKTAMLEKKCAELSSEQQTLVQKLETVQKDCAKECEKYRQMSEILAQKELELNENKTMLSTARNEITQNRQAVDMFQTEFNKIKNEYNEIENNLKEERLQKAQLNKRILELTEEIESYKKQVNSLQEELSKAKKQSELNKVDLRNFYQGQVELLVQNKLKEFQCQLDEQENKFKEEFTKKEKAISKSAAQFLHQILEKHSMEVQLLGKKHQEETEIFQIQVKQHKQQVESLQHKLEQFQKRSLAIAKQVPKVMESQLNEALKIITHGKSPTFNDDFAFNTMDELNTWKTKSYKNLEEVLSQYEEEDSAPPKKSKNEDVGCANDGANGNHHSEQQFETPVSSRIPASRVLSNNDIQQFLSLIRYYRKMFANDFDTFSSLGTQLHILARMSIPKSLQEDTFSL
ncbi:myosin-13 isoform X2 [Diabrotica virgifera virgifera]|uniref:Myosin-13-like isoform X2 n=1 Tax=Diabrotica virgifera virgifera TaxID=50390 RepID=A0A6P7FH10_DIAVI|nr:myosin-13 isoform X2 [Diabrotica virgifera virgifera]